MVVYDSRSGCATSIRRTTLGSSAIDRKESTNRHFHGHRNETLRGQGVDPRQDLAMMVVSREERAGSARDQ